jgi:hypothetical protein
VARYKLGPEEPLFWNGSCCPESRTPPYLANGRAEPSAGILALWKLGDRDRGVVLPGSLMLSFQVSATVLDLRMRTQIKNKEVVYLNITIVLFGRFSNPLPLFMWHHLTPQLSNRE